MLLLPLTVIADEADIVEFAREYAARTMSYGYVRESIETNTIVSVKVANEYCQVNVEHINNKMRVIDSECKKEYWSETNLIL